MTDLEQVNHIKSNHYLTNCYLLEREVFDEFGACKYACQAQGGAFYFFKQSQFEFYKMFFFVDLNKFSWQENFSWIKQNFITEIIFLENQIEQKLQIDNWLKWHGIYQYRTIFRMYRFNDLPADDLNFSLVENPKGDDFEKIRQLLTANFDKYSERIPLIEELINWQHSTYIIKEEDQIAAILVSEMKGLTNELHFWLVLPEFRGKGYGDIVFKYCFNANKKIQRYTSWINIHHDYSIKKHLECGFIKDRIINSIYINTNIMEEKIIKILTETRPEFDFSDKTINFVNAGYLDSFDLLTLVVDLENAFETKINGASIIPENFSSVSAIIKLIEFSKNAS